MFILGPKITHLPHLGHNKNFPQLSTVTFNQFLIPHIRHNLKRNTRNELRLRQKFKNIDFGLKNAPFTPFSE